MKEIKKAEVAINAMIIKGDGGDGVYSQELIEELNELSADDFAAYSKFSREIKTAGINASNQQLFDYVHSESMVRLAMQPKKERQNEH